MTDTRHLSLFSEFNIKNIAPIFTNRMYISCIAKTRYAYFVIITGQWNCEVLIKDIS